MITLLGLMFTVHWIADFLLQTDWMAINKSKQLLPLAAHCLAYSGCFMWMGCDIVLAMFISHFITDYFTSKGTSYLWMKWHEGTPTARHWFFVLIGFDQLVHHMVIIYLAAVYAGGKV